MVSDEPTTKTPNEVAETQESSRSKTQVAHTEGRSPASQPKAPLQRAPQGLGQRARNPANQAIAPIPKKVSHLFSKENLPPGEILFEVKGDMAITFGDIIAGRTQDNFKHKYGRFKPPATQFWDDGVVPYHIAPDAPDKAEIRKTIEYFNKNTPITFIPYTSENDAVVFRGGKEHCYSHLGRIGGLQPIYLSSQCRQKEITHELMHSLGFIHEHSRQDRDQFVEIIWDNIENKFFPQFYKAPDAYMSPFYHTNFDYQSVMIYEPHAFAKKSEFESLRTTNTNSPIQPNSIGLSQGDLDKLFEIYRN